MDVKERLAAIKSFHDTMDGKNHFELLGVAENADDAAVRSAYFGLIKLYGADYFHSVTNPDDKKIIDDVNRQLRLAYDAIGKTEKRNAYTATLHGKTANEDDANAQIDFAKVFECEQAVTQARALMERGEFEVARQKLEKALRLDSRSIEVKGRLAYLDYMLMPLDSNGKRNPHKVEKIRADLESACEDMPRADFLRVYLGDIEKLELQNDKALAWYKKAVAINAENIAAQREIRLMENRAQNAQEKSQSPQSLFEKIKALLTKKL